LNDNLANESISLDVWNVNMDSKKVGPTDSRSSSKGELVMTTQQHLETVPTKIEDLTNSPIEKTHNHKDLNQNSMVVIASQKSIIQEHRASLKANDCSVRTHLKPTDTSNTSKLILNQKPVMISNF
jgi:fructose-specific phosphotransferase system component IIB